MEWRPRAITKLADEDANHQGVVALVPAYKYSTVDTILQIARDRNELPFLLILDGIQDVHNLGVTDPYR